MSFENIPMNQAWMMDLRCSSQRNRFALGLDSFALKAEGRYWGRRSEISAGDPNSQAARIASTKFFCIPTDIKGISN